MSEEFTRASHAPQFRRDISEMRLIQSSSSRSPHILVNLKRDKSETDRVPHITLRSNAERPGDRLLGRGAEHAGEGPL